MPRQPYLVYKTVQGRRVVTDRFGNVVLDNTITNSDQFYAAETAVGDDGHVDRTHFIPPKGYSLERSVVRGGGGSYLYKRWNPSTGHIEQLDHSTGTVLLNGITTSAGDLFYAMGYDNPSFSAMSNAALIAARNKLKDMDVNIAQAIAERNRTANTITGIATRATRAYRNFRRLNFRDGFTDLLGSTSGGRLERHALAKRVLEFQYGLRPLVSDAYGALDLLAKSKKNAWRVHGTGKRGERIKADFPNLSTSFRIGGSIEGFMGAYCRIDAVSAGNVLNTFKQAGITNPLLVAWELVPFSFVADWFVPVGSWLSSLDATLGLNDVFHSSSTILRYRKRLYGTPQTTVAVGSGYYDQRTGEYSCIKDRVSLQRLVGIGAPLPATPGLGSGLSMERCLNAIALLGKAARG